MCIHIICIIYIYRCTRTHAQYYTEVRHLTPTIVSFMTTIIHYYTCRNIRKTASWVCNSATFVRDNNQRVGMWLTFITRVRRKQLMLLAKLRFRTCAGKLLILCSVHTRRRRQCF